MLNSVNGSRTPKGALPGQSAQTNPSGMLSKGLLNNNMYNYRGRRIGNVSCEAIVCSSSRDEFCAV